MSESNQQNDVATPATLKKRIAQKKGEIIKACKDLATFKVSSAFVINENTKLLMRLENELKEALKVDDPGLDPDDQSNDDDNNEGDAE